jgi:hypothetical protein
MIITNNTKATPLSYFIEHPGSSACGDLGPEGEAVLPSFDNKANVKLTLIFPKTGEETEVVIADPGL